MNDAGLRLHNHAILVSPYGTAPIRAAQQFEKSRKLVTVHQNVLVYVRGDAVRATHVVENGRDAPYPER